MVDLVDHGGRRDAAALAELHLRAPNGRAQDVHGGDQIAGDICDDPPDRRECPLEQRGPWAGWSRRCGRPFRKNGDQLVDIAGCPDQRHIASLRLFCGDQAPDQPGTGGVHGIDAGEIDLNPAAPGARLQPLQRRQDACDAVVAPIATRDESLAIAPVGLLGSHFGGPGVGGQ